MLRTWTYAPWKPVVGVLVALVAYLVLASVVLTAVAVLVAGFEPGPFAQDARANLDMGAARPALVLGLNLGIASFIPVTWLLVRYLHGLRPRWLGSVVPRLRRRFLVACLGLAVVALAAQLAVAQVIPHVGDGAGGSLHPVTGRVAVTAVIVLLTTPLQAAGEEYLFRGYLLQAFGALFANRWVGIGASALLFALAHGVQNPPLFLDRLAFGVLAGYLVVRTGGLEAGIALHILNNILAFGLALAFGDLGSTLTVSTVSWWNIVLTVAQSATYVVLVLAAARRFGLQTRTRPPGTPADPVHGPSLRVA
jgi:membrane protease YdiL (CAAX protease family)